MSDQPPRQHWNDEALDQFALEMREFVRISSKALTGISQSVTDISQFVKEIALVVRHISQGTTEISYAVKDITEIMKQIETSRGDLIFAQRSIMAAVERHDRVMDYLIKRDGEKGSESEEA